VVLDTVLFKQIDWWSLVSEESFSAKNAQITNGKVEVYTDRNYAPFPKSKIGNYPNQIVVKSPLPLDIRTIDINNLKVVYEELNPKSQLRGALHFDNIYGTISNITNDKNLIAQNPDMLIEAKGKLMDAANITAVFHFSLAKAKEGIFSVDTHLSALEDATVLNSVTEPLGLFSIEKLNIHSLDAHVDGTNYSGKGTTRFLYNDLSVKVLKKGNDDGEQKKQGLVSFIANTFVLHKSNEGKDASSQSGYYERDVHKSFFNVIWKNNSCWHT